MILTLQHFLQILSRLLRLLLQTVQHWRLFAARDARFLWFNHVQQSRLDNTRGACFCFGLGGGANCFHAADSSGGRLGKLIR